MEACESITGAMGAKAARTNNSKYLLKLLKNEPELQQDIVQENEQLIQT